MEDEIRRWLASKQAYIRENAETVTPKMLRSLVAQELKLTKEEVDPFKKLIKSIAVEFLTAPVTPTVQAAVHAPSLEDDHNAVGSSGGESEDEEEEEEEEESRTARSSAKKVERKKKQKSPATVKKKQKQKKETKSGGVGATRLITKAKKILKEASIRVPPNIYKKNKTTELLEQALVDLLGKHDLQIASTRKDIQKVRKRLEIERDMDGIDMSNVLEGRRPRRGAANSFDFVAQMETQQDISSEEEGEHSTRKETQTPIKRNHVIDSESESDM